MQAFLQYVIFATLGQMLVLGVVVFRDIRGQPLGRALLLLMLCTAAYLLCSDKDLLSQTGSLAFLLALGSISVPVVLWLTAMVLFVDEFNMRTQHYLAAAVLLMIGYFNVLTGDFMGQPVVFLEQSTFGAVSRPAQQLLNISFLAHALYTAYQGRAHDLVDGRRYFRVYFIGVGAGTTIVMALVELVLPPGAEIAFHAWAGPLGVFAVFNLLAYWLLRIGAAAELNAAGNAGGSLSVEAIDPADQAMHQGLIKAFDMEHLYREHALTISSLARQLGVPEHQLRRLINRGMGFKNFAAFLNTYRLREVEAMLADPAHAKTPILTIAMNAGFQSMATFNRAFRHAHNSTPSQFRKEALSGSQK